MMGDLLEKCNKHLQNSLVKLNVFDEAVAIE